MTIFVRSSSWLKRRPFLNACSNCLPGNSAVSSKLKISVPRKHISPEIKELSVTNSYINEREYIQNELPRSFADFLLSTRKRHFLNLLKH